MFTTVTRDDKCQVVLVLRGLLLLLVILAALLASPLLIASHVLLYMPMMCVEHLTRYTKRHLLKRLNRITRLLMTYTLTVMCRHATLISHTRSILLTRLPHLTGNHDII